LVAGVIAVGLLLRVWGIGFGLPFEYQVDEVQYVRQGASLATRALEPAWWNNPPFFKYMLLGEYAGLFGLGRLLGWYASIADFSARHTLDPTPLYILGRATAAGMGAATVWLVYRLGLAAYGRRVALLAAWFLAVCFLHVRDSHYAVNDVPTTFWMAASLWAAVRVAQSAQRRWSVLAGVTLGLGIATKYTAILAVVPLVVAHVVALRTRRAEMGLRWTRELAIGPAVACLVAVLASPYFILTPGLVWHDIAQEVALNERLRMGIASYGYYLDPLVWGFGAALLALGVCGSIIAMRRHSPSDLVIVSLPLSSYTLLGLQGAHFARQLLPIVPALVLLSAVALDAILTRLVSLRQGWWQLALVASAVLVSVQPLSSSIRHDYLLGQTDSRTLAKAWIESHVAAGTKIAVDWPTYAPPLASYDKPVAGSSRMFDVTVLGGMGAFEHPLSWYRANHFEYLVINSFIASIGLEYQPPEERAFYASLDQELDLVQEFRTYTTETDPPFKFEEIYGPAADLWQRVRPGPTIKIYRLS
jgi:hypothetical protein